MLGKVIHIEIKNWPARHKWFSSVKAGPRDYTRDPCVEYTQELIKTLWQIKLRNSNAPPTFLRDFLSLEEEDALYLNDLEEEIVFSSAKISEYCGLL